MAELRRFKKSISDGGSLAAVLTGDLDPETHPLGSGVSLDDLDSLIAQIPDDVEGPELDTRLVTGIREALPVSKRDAADPLMWEWVSAKRYPAVVWRRWLGYVPSNDVVSEVLKPSLREHFLSSPTLRGTARNTFARLWWVGETLGASPELRKGAVSTQDRFVAIFERRFGTYKPAARACVRAFDGRTESEIRESATWLSQVLSTTALESLDESQILEILAERLPFAPTDA